MPQARLRPRRSRTIDLRAHTEGLGAISCRPEGTFFSAIRFLRSVRPSVRASPRLAALRPPPAHLQPSLPPSLLPSLQVINDGVTIARAIELPDPVENAGAQLIKEVAGRTNDSAGDGTTTASVLAREMIRLGLQSVTAGANPISINKGIDKTRRYLTEKLEELAKPISGSAEIKAVASISAGNNDEIGEMIADAIEKVGADGVLSIENGSGLDTTVEVEEGMEIDRGYISPQFVTNSERLQVEFEGARILVTDEKIEQVKDLVPILEEVSQNGGDPAPHHRGGRRLGEALATLVVNKLRGVHQGVRRSRRRGSGTRRKAAPAGHGDRDQRV